MFLLLESLQIHIVGNHLLFVIYIPQILKCFLWVIIVDLLLVKMEGIALLFLESGNVIVLNIMVEIIVKSVMEKMFMEHLLIANIVVDQKHVMDMELAIMMDFVNVMKDILDQIVVNVHPTIIQMEIFVDFVKLLLYVMVMEPVMQMEIACVTILLMEIVIAALSLQLLEEIALVLPIALVLDQLKERFFFFFFNFILLE